MLDKATVVVDNDQYYVTSYHIQLVNPDGTEKVVSTILGAVPKGENFDKEDNASRQNHRIPVTIFL